MGRWIGSEDGMENKNAMGSEDGMERREKWKNKSSETFVRISLFLRVEIRKSLPIEKIVKEKSKKKGVHPQ